jgi:death on curing protein
MDEPVWLTRGDVEALHHAQIREHGGRFGLRDPGLLESALARPLHVWSYETDVELCTLAAEVAFGLAKNHAFLDGNKRTALVATNVFLILNGFEIDASEPEIVETMLRLADGRLSRDEFATWLRRSIVPLAD